MAGPASIAVVPAQVSTRQLFVKANYLVRF
jgi:hypothetical protein